MTKETKAKKCLFLIAEKEKWGVHEYLKPLNAFYNGSGWYIEEKHREDVEQISHQANMRYIEWPLNNETFEDLKRKHKADFFNVKSVQKKLKIDSLRASLGLDSLTIEDLKNVERRTDLEAIEKGKQLIESIDEYDRLQTQLSILQQEEQISKISIKHESHLKPFLNSNSEKEIRDEIKEISDGLHTGFTIGNMDLIIPGGAITIVAAPTSHGKTATLINFTLGVLNRHYNKNIYFFTYEESASSIMCLFLNTWIGKELSKNNRESIKSHFRKDNVEHIKVEMRKEFLKDKNAFFENLIDKGRLKVFYTDKSLEELIALIKFLKLNDPSLGMICIDYMQFLKLAKRPNSRQEELKDICLKLKDCAVETGLPILLAAQFNRTVVAEADLSPTNIGEAGDIERAANLIIGMWNRNFEGFSRLGNVDRTNKKIPKESAIYFEVLKGRGVAPGQFTIMDFDGNTGKLQNRLTTSNKIFG